MTILAVIRADEVNFPLFLHVLGAMLLVGSLFAVASAIVIGWRRSEPADAVGLTRLGLWTLLVGVLPSFLLMRIAGEWTYSKENLGDQPDKVWVGIGFLTSDVGGLLLLAAIVLAIIGLRKTSRGDGLRLGRAVGIISTLLLAAYVIAVWAMTVKPD